jgi:hypothetical protein
MHAAILVQPTVDLFPHWCKGCFGEGCDVTPPHKEIINGQEVWVGSVVVPLIDMAIPIRGKSLAEILSIVSGIRPLDEGASDQDGK